MVGGEAGFGVGEFVAVPVEDVAFAVDAGVARGELEAVAGDGVGADVADKVLQAVLRIRGVGVAHGGAGVAEAPFGREGVATGECHEAAGVVEDARAMDEVVVEVAIFGAVAAVARVVVVQLVAHVEGAGIEVVVVEAVVCTFAVHDLVVGPVFVERVGGLGVVAHRVEAFHLVALAVAVHGAGFFAEAVVAVACVQFHVVGDAGARVAELVGTGRAVAGDGAPVVAVFFLPFEPQRAVDDQAQGAAGEGEAVIILADGDWRAGEACAARPLAPFYRAGRGVG